MSDRYEELVNGTYEGEWEVPLNRIHSNIGDDIEALQSSVSAENVEEYGAVGDGTTDDTAAIQEALNAQTHRVILPEGTYNITSTLDVGTSHLLGVGKGDSVISVGAEMTHAVTVEGNHGGVSDLSVEGNANTPVGIRLGGEQSFCDRVEVDNVSQYGANTDTVSCIQAISAPQCRIAHCTATQASAPNSGVSRGILLDGSTGGGGLVEGNYVDNVTPVDDGDGIVVQEGNPNTRIANNRVTNAAKSAMKINIGASSCTVTGNSLHASSGALSVMRIQASGTSFTGNTVTVPTVTGELVRVSDGASDVTISGNTLELTGSGTTADGVRIRDTESNIEVAGNSIAMNNSGRHGIQTDASTGISIDSNTITDPDQRGINLESPTGCTVVGNNIVSAGAHGVFVGGGSRIVISGNAISSAFETISDTNTVATVGTNAT